MSAGLGFVERKILVTLPGIVQQATLTVAGQPREALVVAGSELCTYIYGGEYTRSQKVATYRALKSLAKAGQVALLHARRGSRTYLLIEFLNSEQHLKY